MPKPPIQLKRSGTASATPASLLHGELAINYNVADGKLFWKDSSGAIRSFSLQDEVVEYQATSNFPSTGSTTLLYLATDASRAYRWTGSEYVEVGASSLSAGGGGGSSAGGPSSRALTFLVR